MAQSVEARAPTNTCVDQCRDLIDPQSFESGNPCQSTRACPRSPQPERRYAHDDVNGLLDIPVLGRPQVVTGQRRRRVHGGPRFTTAAT